MKIRNINSVNLKGKKVVVRIDINSTVIKGKPQDSPRFKESVNTIKILKNKGAKIFLIAHQGQEGKDDFTSLENHAKIINKYTKLKFIKNLPKSPEEFSNMKNGEAVLLENIRFNNEEFSNSHSPNKNSIINLFKDFDYYINDAFSVSHRKQTSITGLPKILKSLVGPTFEKELKSAQKIKEKINSCLFVLGGAKPSDVILLTKNKYVLSTGKLSLLALKAKGYELGKEDFLLGPYKELLRNSNLKRIKTPIDLAVEEKGKRKNIELNDLPINKPLLDIGDNTIKLYSEEIKKAKIIFFKGSTGYTENKNFESGTKGILKALAEATSKGSFTVVAGGDSSTFLEKLGIKNKISHVSLSGGALVHFIAGKKLPGLEVLKNN